MKNIYLLPLVLFSLLIVSCNDEWEKEQYEHYISFRPPLDSEGVTKIYVPYTRKDAKGNALYGNGISTYRLPVIVSGSLRNEKTMMYI